MVNEIYQGDQGTTLNITIQDNSGVVNLTGAIVDVTIKYKGIETEKRANVVDGVNGKCEIILTSDNTKDIGSHSFQCLVTFQDGKKFSSDIQRYTVYGNL